MYTCYSPVLFNTNPLGSQGDSTELLHREQLGSPIRQVGEQLGSHAGSHGRIGSLHVPAEHQLHTTLMYIEIVTHSLSACKAVRMAATAVTMYRATTLGATREAYKAGKRATI